jgi:hypothetical protein
MINSVIRVVLAALAAATLAVAVALLITSAAQATPEQPNVPVFTYGSG